MKAASLRELSVEELQQKLVELRESHFNLKFQHATGQLENTAQLKQHKRNIARVLTVLREKQSVSEA
ncbi:LSU ribosomal protein L29P [Desulfacinum hydrothermale DSM 13146]|uniref:Large ribosomal subunit protein uL29 n=1 Tax=Desulfacinum hydrothermale DSM 13146 TaxID=1121390 RepID=A0A1W1XQI4_9BACT|nr:50S ribosomal protein L29 [Desulfacinum hydrothermale]SMC26134.1 LSU ribosomal protein L29P [Desulfacinum hydrothermale DSM 13146]